MAVEPWMVYLLVASSLLSGALVGCAASLLCQELRCRRTIRGLGLEPRDGRRSQAVCDLELNEDERGWLEAHGIDAG
ncbi:MAG: hypothetical protein M3179_09475 [Actinomycetota bacterium]|nr:hypothetical protein [Actinomycetota bacterium]